jgi:hypothetical protein
LKSSVQARLHAHASAFYTALLSEGEISLASDFARWWLDRTRDGWGPLQDLGEGINRDLLSENYSLDELGIDQEDRE